MLCCTGLLLAEAAFFSYILLRVEPVPEKSGAIVVFLGDARRIEAGVDLLKKGNAPQLILSPTPQHVVRRLPAELAQQLIKEDKARTTFENALYTSRLARSHNIHSLVLVTSDYHMPRSYFLLQALLLGQNTSIYRYPVQSGRTNSSVFPPRSTRDAKILYNEMVELWGSLGEWLAYSIKGDVPAKNAPPNKYLRMLRQALLFDV
ncbi:MAG: YdcF family protein [Desulfobulbaceae bacterium]|nr:YdcF family protein [Desulfobulbaceae bacterium]